MKKSEKTEITVARILASAMEEFGKRGYAGGSVNNICKAGINKGLVYHNFSGKDELYLRCLDGSCQKLIEYIRAHGGATDLNRYLTARMDFLSAFPNEAHIFFEALLNPAPHLANEIGKALAALNRLNEQVYLDTLRRLTLRDGVTIDEAVSYFHLMQTMLNGYFGSPAFQNLVLQEKVKRHESAIPKLLDLLLYGIAKGEG